MAHCLAVVCMFVAACSNVAPVCVPGASVACVGAAGCAGGQVCADDGTRLLACVCAVEPDGGADRATGDGSADARDEAAPGDRRPADEAPVDTRDVEPEVRPPDVAPVDVAPLDAPPADLAPDLACPAACDDGNPCTADACEAGRCVARPLPRPGGMLRRACPLLRRGVLRGMLGWRDVPAGRRNPCVRGWRWRLLALLPGRSVSLGALRVLWR